MCSGPKYLGHFTPSVPPNHNISTDFCQLRESTRLDGLAQTNRTPRGGRGGGRGVGGTPAKEWRGWSQTETNEQRDREKTNRWRRPAAGDYIGCRRAILSSDELNDAAAQRRRRQNDPLEIMKWQQIVRSSIKALHGGCFLEVEIPFVESADQTVRAFILSVVHSRSRSTFQHHSPPVFNGLRSDVRGPGPTGSHFVPDLLTRAAFTCIAMKHGRNKL